MGYVSRSGSLDNKYVNVTSPPKVATVFNKTADYTITTGDLDFFWGGGGGAVFTNLGASGNVKFTLPESPASGYEIVFHNAVGTHQVNVLVSGSDQIYNGTVVGKSWIYNTAQGASLTATHMGSGVWYVKNFSGATPGP